MVDCLPAQVLFARGCSDSEYHEVKPFKSALRGNVALMHPLYSVWTQSEVYRKISSDFFSL